jgi:predicted ATPase/transcriptional regulator with XRE-family HTH domain
VNQSFGSWVRRRRKGLDLTQQALAKQVGCSVSLILKIELDERRPSHQIAELLAEQLAIPGEQRDLFLKIARQEKGTQTLDLIAQPDTPPSRPTSTLVSVLPIPLTSFVGRGHELDAILRQLQNSHCRLLTLVGPGGVGKTRLALEVAHRIRDSFDHEVYFISLVGTSSSEFIIPAIANAVGFVFSGAAELKTQLFNHLRNKQILLVLDNLEHLLDGIELLDELLSCAPSVKLLTTSREQLNLRAEWVFEVHGLPVPAMTEWNDLASNSAIALFVQRAKQVKLHFSPTPEDLSSITRICRLVDGLPLALELAGTWVRMMSVQEIVSEIERSIDFLNAPTRDIPERHRSIRAVFDHSWELLSGDEQSVLMELSVFRGGFTRAAAEEVTGTSLAILSSLADKSIIRHSISNRLDMHELLRQYAAMRLQADGKQAVAIQRKHAAYYLTLIQEREPALRSAQQKDTLLELRAEIDNLRVAWDFAVANNEHDLMRNATGGLYYFYELHQYFQEAEILYKHAAEVMRTLVENFPANADDDQRAKLEGVLGEMLTRQAFFVQRIGRTREAVDLHNHSIALLRPLKEPATLTFALVYCATLYWTMGDRDEALTYLHDGLNLTRDMDGHWLRAVTLCFMGVASHDEGNYEAAFNWFTESMELCNNIKDPYMTLLVSALFGRTLLAQGNLLKAQGLLSNNLQIARESDNRWATGLALEQLAGIAQSLGNHAEARRMLEESVALDWDVGDPWSLSRALNSLSQIALIQSDLPRAEESVIQAVTVAAKIDHKTNALEALATLAEVHARRKRHTDALEIAQFVLEDAASPQKAKAHAEKIRVEAEAHFTSEELEAIRSHGRTLTLDVIMQKLAE